MKNLFQRALLLVTALVLVAGTALADTPKYKISKWTPNDGGIFESISRDGKWGVINLGMSGGDANTSCPSRIYDIDNDKDYILKVNNRELSISAVSDVDANGMIRVVGSYMGRAAACLFDTNTKQVEASSLKIFAKTENWTSANLNAVTADGKYAVGMEMGYYGVDASNNEMGSDYWYKSLYVNIETGSVIATPGIPEKNLAGSDEFAIKFTGITPDGRYIVGEKDWFIMQPNCPLAFVYDTQEHTYKVIGFTGTPGQYQGVVQGLHHIEMPVLSPNGKLITGDAYMAKAQEGSEFFNEYHTPFVYNIETGEFKNFDDSDSQNVIGSAIDNEGNIYGAPEGGGPLRNFKIFYKQKYWIPFSQICQQVYGFNFSQKTGFEFTGTPVGVSGNGQRLISFSDPSEAESYAFDFGAPFSEIANNIDLLSSYTVSPESGSTFSLFKNVEINFGRAVQIVGKGGTHVHLYNKKTGERVRDGLTTNGIDMKTNSKTTVVFTVRNYTLEDGVEYELVIDAGAVALATDETMTNREIRLKYIGRKAGAVTVVKATPENGSKMNHMDAGTSYVQLTFDCPVKLTDKYEAYIERLEEGDQKTRLATLSLATGNTDATKNQLLMYPTSPIYMYDNIQYKVTLSAGSVSDYAGSESSYNNEWSAIYDGAYIREVATESTLFLDDFNDPNVSLSKWLQYEGDHQTPQASMQNWGFDADNTPWNYSTRDSENTADYFATSHSLYAPSAQSDDWMMTPQLLIPEDGKAALYFDAQSYRSNKEDHLLVYVIPEDRNTGYINEDIMAVLKGEAELLADIKLSAGASEEGTNGEWTKYSYSLADYANKNVYIAFVNQNNNQSAVFVDNVSVQREILYTIGFSNEERVVNKENITIKGNFTVKTKDFNSGSITLKLKNSEGSVVSEVNWPSVSGAIYDRAIPFTFSNPLPLTVGKQNKYSIDIIFDGKNSNNEDYKRSETYESSILNLAFTPTKRVVLEEMTGITCPNCPQGIISIEACERQYKDQFIPISIHSYTGDTYGAQFGGYSSFLGLSGAPSGRINRIAGNAANAGIYYPMYGDGTNMFYDMKEQELWYNVVGQELEELATCDVDIKANYSQDEKQIHVKSDVKYALDAEQQVSVFYVVLEDGIISYQENNFYGLSSEGLGEWGQGGTYGQNYAYPVTHNDLVRGVVGQTYAGTLGLLPQQFEAGTTYNITQSFNIPDAIQVKENAKVVIMLIDTQNGEVINAACSKILPYDPTGVEEIDTDTQKSNVVYNLSGIRVSENGMQNLPAGIYIMNGKTVIKK